MSELPGFFTPEQVAAQLQVGQRWLEDQARQDAVPHCRFGRRVRFTAEQVQAIAEAFARGAVAGNSWGLTPRSKSRKKGAA